MWVLGCDPGQTGGLALVNSDDLKIYMGIRMPTMKVRSKTLVDGRALDTWLKRAPEYIDTAICEWVHAMPRQGVSSSFSFGRNTGAVETLAQVHSRSMEWVTPKKWKSHFALSSDKAASIDTAKRLFGDSYTWQYKADDGIAEAALMARWYLDMRAKM